MPAGGGGLYHCVKTQVKHDVSFGKLILLEGVEVGAALFL